MVPHILIIDADASAAQATAAVMTRVVPDATLDIELTPERGLLNMQRHRPDILVVDLSLHSLTGVRLIVRFKEECPQGSVIVVASAPTPALRRSMQELDVDMYLEKPAPLARCIPELRAALHGDGSGPQVAAFLNHPDT